MRKLKEGMDGEYIITHATVDVHKDSYSDGEGKWVNEYDLIRDAHIKTRFKSLKDLIKELASQGFPSKVSDYGIMDDNSIHSDFLGDENNYPVSENDPDYKAWENDKKILYNNHLYMKVEVVRARELSYEEGLDIGFQDL